MCIKYEESEWVRERSGWNNGGERGWEERHKERGEEREGYGERSWGKNEKGIGRVRSKKKR
jgi:hypothetical protein